HSSFPAKSNAFRIPVPVITQTFLPSVTGEGDDMFCLRILVLPALRCFFQSGSPLVRSTHQRNRSLPSATFRKMRSPQMMGVAPVQLGKASFHVTFSSALHLNGRFFSLLTPLSEGPRHCGQLSPNALVVARMTIEQNQTARRCIWALRGCYVSGFRAKDEVSLVSGNIELHRYRCTGSRATRLISSARSEEHTSELQSRQYLVCRL